jgi:PAS domain S-box-containing protein
VKRLKDLITLQPFAITVRETDLVSRHRLRLFKIATMLSLVVYIGFLIQVLLILPDKPLLLGFMFLLLCSLFANFFALIWHKKPTISYIILISIWFILIHVNTYYSAGIKNSGNFYLAIFILTAFILLGRTGGKIAATLSVLHVVYFFFITTHTHLVTYVPVGEGEALLNVYSLFSISVSLLMLAAGSNYFEKSKNVVVEDLHLKNEQLTDASGRLQHSTRAAKIGIWDFDLVNQIITWDSTMFTLHGVAESFAVTGKTWQSIVHPGDIDKLVCQFRLQVAGEKENSIEYRIIWHDQTTRYIKAVAQVHYDKDGKALRILGANWDITESKKAGEAIINSSKRYELATKATSNAIWDWNLLTGEHIWSEAYQLAFGDTPAGLTESFETYASRIHTDDYARVNEGLLAVITGKNGDYWEDEYKFQKSDGTYAYVYDRGYLVFDESNRPIRFVGALQDVTNRKQVEIEKEMIISELIKSNADLKQFSFITSHNLRAPLSNISSILDLIEPATLDAHNRSMFNMLKISGKQLVTTIDDLTNILLVKNNRNAEITRIDIADVLDEIKRSFSTALSEVNGHIFSSITAPHVWFHKVYLESLFINLISNSIKYCSPNRMLIITIVGSADANGDYIFTFSDNGLGIDLNRYKDRIFGLYQRFHDTASGQGLGLFIIKSQIEAIGGNITVESEVDKGATFTVTFRQQLYKQEKSSLGNTSRSMNKVEAFHF